LRFVSPEVPETNTLQFQLIEEHFHESAAFRVALVMRLGSDNTADHPSRLSIYAGRGERYTDEASGLRFPVPRSG